MGREEEREPRLSRVDLDPLFSLGPGQGEIQDKDEAQVPACNTMPRSGARALPSILSPPCELSLA